MRTTNADASLLDKGSHDKSTDRASSPSFIGKWITYVIPGIMLLAAVGGVVVVIVQPPGDPRALVRVASKASLSVKHDALHALNCSSGQEACARQQIKTLKDAIEEGFTNIDSWRTWAHEHGEHEHGEHEHGEHEHVQVKMPNYGFWRMAQQVNTNSTHDKWIVITSIAAPTEQVKAWAALKDWKVVVVSSQAGS
jgi:hypothetical protein